MRGNTDAPPPQVPEPSTGCSVVSISDSEGKPPKITVDPNFSFCPLSEYTQASFLVKILAGPVLEIGQIPCNCVFVCLF